MLTSFRYGYYMPSKVIKDTTILCLELACRGWLGLGLLFFDSDKLVTISTKNWDQTQQLSTLVARASQPLSQKCVK